MKPEQFEYYLENPSMMDEAATAEFAVIIREYPFCQPAQLLYTKGLHNQGHISFNRQLKIASAYAGDRSLLYDLINTATGATSTVAPENTKTGDAVVPAAVSGEAGKAPETEVPDLAGRLEQVVPITDYDLLPFDFPAYTGIDLPPLPSETRAPEFIPSSAPDAGDAAGSGFSDEELLRHFLETDPLSKQQSGKPAIRPMRIDRDKPLLSGPVPKRSPADDLIDRFIGSDEPKVVRPGRTEPAPQDISSDSSREDDEFMTETLARIYVQQGYYLKAIQAYEKLSLKIPEKSVYFASQIEMVRDRIKNQ